MPKEQVSVQEIVNEPMKKNYDRLKALYGETFAREIRGELPEYPDFVDQIRRLVPNKDRSLQTLQDNIDYIRVLLADHYLEQDETIESLAGNPKELAKQAGYELFGPFTNAGELENFRQDFREHEVLCTYNEPEARLKAYYILWLRHKNAEAILPADQLTQDNLSPEWKAYLKENGRYKSELGQYNLTRLRPEREDPYGTSSMSVQISRTTSYVSIKNRYNHSLTGKNPDATFGNDLDAITPGLKQAVYEGVGRADLLEYVVAEPAGGYIADNDRGLHPYFYESNNVYYGYYETISNGQVTVIPQDRYHMLSPDLYIGKGKKTDIKELNIDTNYSDPTQTQLLNNEDGSQSVICKKNGSNVVTYTYTVDSRNRMQNLVIVVEGTIKDIQASPASKIKLTKGASVNYIVSPNLRTLEIAEDARVEYLLSDSLTNLKIAEGANIGTINGDSLTTLKIAERASVEYVTSNSLLTLDIAEGARVEYISSDSLTALNIDKGAFVFFVTGSIPSLKTLKVYKGFDNPILKDFVLDNNYDNSGDYCYYTKKTT